MQTTRTETPAAINDTIQKALEGKQFKSLEEANQFLAQQSRHQNSRAIDDFAGLSPEQMHGMLHAPYDSPNTIRFTEQFSRQPEAPILTLFKLLVEAVGEEGVKATAKGNLPIKLCRDIADQYWDDDHAYMRKFTSETDFNELHALRLTAKMAGLLHKYKGRFVLTAKCKKLLKQQGVAGTYLPLLKAYTTRAIERFARFFGLAETKQVGKESKSNSQIRKTPMLFELIHFHTDNESLNPGFI